MSSTYYTTEGIVLKKTPYGEADFLVRILTLDFGKIDLRARGVRKEKSKLNSHLDFLDQISISFVKNGEGIPTIIDAEKIFSHVHWFLGERILREAGKVARFLDLIIPLEAKDAKLFCAAVKFFAGSYQKTGQSFARDVILYEGYGDTLSLPPEAQDFIMKEWQTLKS
ncbi:MAG: DNA repair protein RecO [Patescibacteria group bacterium]